MPRRLVLIAMIAASGGCSGADSGPVFTADEVPTPAPTPTTQPIVPLTTLALSTEPAALPPATLAVSTEPAATAPVDVGTASTSVAFDLVAMLEPGVAEITGTGASSTDPVTVDDQPSGFLTFEITADEGFLATVPIPTNGTHTVCIAGTCGTVDSAG